MTSTSHDPRAWQRPEDSAARPASARLVDPEDDIPSSTYAGDFETTAIPRYDSNTPNPERTGYGLLHEPEPLPYVQPAAGKYQTPSAEPTEIEPDVGFGPADQQGRRGTQDLGLMVLRMGLGALLIAHGLQKAFGLWGGQGFSGFQQSLVDMGYQHADVLTYVGVAGQIGAGVLLVLGLFTPVAAAGAVAYLINSLLAAVAAQPDKGYFAFFLPDGHEYLVMLLVLAAALVLTGPGKYGFDAGRGWSRRPFVGSAVALVLGIGVGVGVWVLLNGTNPLA
ncbi:DoxX family protein [Mycolicibacterium sp. P1-18]|uniref:DoxX family protein n=1 Tax=Mycolicibacterium sp. P1-18 TaxID=2024615 RepID=UPI0011F0AAD9|nr:DoxX family protein [Mycolicibacterium sp. P1-18]KAA0100748.1 DoxX family protein [Mycolicibacterium sp. P1-18]